MKSLFLGILLIVIVGIGGLVYRNAIEHYGRSNTCALDVFICPDSTSVARVAPACQFPACPPPNVSLPAVNIAFAVSDKFIQGAFPDTTTLADYVIAPTSSDVPTAEIIVHDYVIAASSTPLGTIQETAIGGASGIPVSPTSFTYQTFGTHRFTVVRLERFEGVVHTAFYFSRESDVLRFDAIDRNVSNWTDARLDLSTLPAHSALQKMLGTLQG